MNRRLHRSLRARQCATTKARRDAQQTPGVAHVTALPGRTVYPQANCCCVGADVPGKPRGFVPLIGFPAYAEGCAGFALA